MPLPQPVTSTSSQTFRSWLNHRRAHVLNRSRVTSLAVYVLAATLLLSLTANLNAWADNTRLRRINQSRTQSPALLRALRSSLNKDSFGNASHLVIVAGHAIWRGCNSTDWTHEDNWVLQEHQKGTGSSRAFYSHIEKGVSLLNADPSAILLFSGGITRPGHQTQSEAQSYLALAQQTSLLPQWSRTARPARVFTEDYALDSFQNLFFSIMRFHELAIASGRSGRSSWPSKITVVGFEMKKRRFLELHRHALRWSEDRFDYVGVDFLDTVDKELGWKGEEAYGYRPYASDLYGCHGELEEKRVIRNPYARVAPYALTNPELVALIEWCPPISDSFASHQLFPGPLPWDSL
ncbi:hypothetical protein FRC19_003436 [Serendipita sp. 401]|nr:hypothetical protein FRC19_003436 [Serendipita sp. 401]KAG9055447.1 hypothetical protein FS842_002187 [Serendipita sp. 407]